MRRSPIRSLPFAAACLAALAIAHGCRPGAGEDADAADAEPVVDEAARSRLIGARDALLERLSARLMEAMGDGPDAAIAVCAEEALPLTAEVADAHGVRIGRTSHRLRNPANTPPAWARDLLAALPEADVFEVGPGGEARAFMPIRLQDRCVLCHGDPDQIPEPIAVALAARYPDDDATGFAPGDIRGYVWAELIPGSAPGSEVP